MRRYEQRVMRSAAISGILGLVATMVFQGGGTPARAAAAPPDDHDSGSASCTFERASHCLRYDDRRPGGNDLSFIGGAPARVHDNRGAHARLGKNVFVNDPCLDPAPPVNYSSLPTTDPASVAARRGTMQSATALGVLSRRDGSRSKMVVGYQDTLGNYDNRQGVSGYAYTTDGGAHWVDGGGLPPLGVDDQYLGSPSIAVHQRSETFYYASAYIDPTGQFTLSVNRGRFRVAPPGASESNANARCLDHPERSGIPDATDLPKERIVWEPPVVAVNNLGPDDFASSESLFVDQKTGELYLSYVRENADFTTPDELVRSTDGGRTWSTPTTIVPTSPDTANDPTEIVVTPSGRVVVSWLATQFDIVNPSFPEIENRIEVAYSDDDGATFIRPIVVAKVNPQAGPPGFNSSLLGNDPSLTVAGRGEDGEGEYDRRRGGDALYIAYTSGKTPLPAAGPIAAAGNILLSRSTDGGATWKQPLKINDDDGTTSHVFPTVQASRDGRVYVAWLDRRGDPTNELTNTWADVSNDGGATFGVDQVQSDVATSWRVRSDGRPNFGRHNASALLGDGRFALVWADGRFTPVAGTPATPDVIFSVASGLGGRD